MLDSMISVGRLGVHQNIIFTYWPVTNLTMKFMLKAEAKFVYLYGVIMYFQV